MAVIKKDLYFEWLLDIVDGFDYYGIMWRLYTREFEWTKEVAMDENRAYDGLKLREDYIQENGDDGIGSECCEGCSILEMLIALSIKCEKDVMQVNGAGDRTIDWFWIMIDNLGLYNEELEEDLKDDICQGSAEDEINYILEQFMDRRYSYDGSNGGLFVLDKPRGDMRKTDIWMQLNWWLVEKYGYECE